MVRKLPFLFVFLAFSLSSYAQNLQLIASLRKKAVGSLGKERFDVLNDLAWEYRSSYPDSTIYFAKEAYSIGQNLKLTTGLAEPLNFIGVAYNYKGNRLKSYNAYDEALKISTQYHDSLQLAYCNNNLGRLFFEQGILPRAYDYFIKAQAIFEDINDPSGLAYTYQSLARLYKSQRDLIKSENNYLKANKIRMQLGNAPDIISAFIQTGRFYQESREDQKALDYLHRADSIASAIPDEIYLAETKSYIAKGLLNQGRIKEAREMCEQALKVIVQKNNIRMQPQAYIIMGQVELADNNFKLAKNDFTTALNIATNSKDLASRMDAHFNLWKSSELDNNKSAEIMNMNQYLILKDSIKDLDLTREVERFQFQIDIAKKDQENELLKVEQGRKEAIIKQQRLQNILLIIVVGFVSIIGFIQWRSSKRRREINEKLEQQNKFIQNQRQEIVDQNEKLFRRNHQLSDLNHEKDTLMGIVAHDLKSPLNRIKGLADLMELEGGLVENQHQYLKMTKDATQSGLDLIMDLLDAHKIEEDVVPNYSSFDISQFLLDKIRSFTPAAESKGIHLHINKIESEQIDMDANYLHRIIDNLLTNAIKFSDRNTSIEISATKSGDELMISLKDQGQGFTEKDKQQLFQKFKKLSARPTAGESSNGLGLAIVKTLVDRLKGKIELVSDPGKGSQFTVRLPVTRNI
ncbi:MAG: ATP-binding protein [Chryseolinea sp.]